MRLIGHLSNEEAARVLGDFLYVQGIENQVEHEPADGWGIWIHDEDKIEAASRLLADFRQNPADPKYRAEAKTAAELRSEKEAKEEAYRKKLRSRRHLFRPMREYRFGPLTFALVAASIGVFILSRFGENLEPIRFLFITDPALLDAKPALTEIRHGQVWRLMTPVLIHFSALHIFFNLWWLADLGSMVEGRQSSGYLALLVLGIAVGSNLAQFYWAGPVFGGMSGVVYGLLGYVWIRGKLDPGSGLYLHPTTVTMMMIWLVAGFTGILGSIANLAHIGGLALGVAWGYLASLRYR